MTEAEYLSCDDPWRMLEFPAGGGVRLGGALVSERKLRLWVEACRRVAGPGPPWANKMKSAAALQTAVSDWSWGADWVEECPLALRAALLRDLAGNPFRQVAWTDKANGRPSYRELDNADLRPLLVLRRAWLTPAVLSLARAAHEQRLPDGFLDSSRLLVLSDALEEAGCADEHLLRHLRGEEVIPSPHMPKLGLWGALRSPHVPGCHVVDLLLGLD